MVHLQSADIHSSRICQMSGQRPMNHVIQPVQLCRIHQCDGCRTEHIIFHAIIMLKISVTSLFESFHTAEHIRQHLCIRNTRCIVASFRKHLRRRSYQIIALIPQCIQSFHTTHQAHIKPDILGHMIRQTRSQRIYLYHGIHGHIARMKVRSDVACTRKCLFSLIRPYRPGTAIAARNPPHGM